MFYLTEPEKFNPKLEAAGCFVESDGKFIILHRQDHKAEGDTWGLPAGKISENETPLEAITREIKEETGIVISSEKMEYLIKIFVRYPTYDSIFHIFRSILVEPASVKIDTAEHKDYRWVPPKEALSYRLIEDLDTVIRMFYEDLCQ